MAQWRDVVRDEVHQELSSSGMFNPHDVVRNKIKPRLDPEDIEYLADRALYTEAKNCATRAQRAAESEAEEQGELLFPELRKAYLVQGDGIDSMIKRTELLSKEEFNEIIEVRKEQVRIDQKHVRALEQAYYAVLPYWDRYPTYTYEQVEKLYKKDMTVEAERPLEEVFI